MLGGRRMEMGAKSHQWFFVSFLENFYVFSSENSPCSLPIHLLNEIVIKNYNFAGSNHILP
jgi:hypothetical protein